MRKSAIPVLMLRPERESETTKRRVAARGVKRILVPMDGSGLATGIVPAATDLARTAHASITLLRVVPIVPIVMAYEPTLPVTSLPVVPDEAATQQLVDGRLGARGASDRRPGRGSEHRRHRDVHARSWGVTLVIGKRR
jgi:nucleotide-binding universal stress UspA family protein